jgi:small subunit ribosomal protein S6
LTLPAPTYDLVLLLDTQAEDSARAKILADARSSIEARGELVRHDEWGERPLAYPIRRRKNAEYHLFQFHAGDTELLSGLDRTLRITDGVMRFRLIKLRPGVPDPPDMRSSAAGARRAEGEAVAHAAGDEPARAEPAATQAASAPAEGEASAEHPPDAPPAGEAAPAESGTAPAETPAPGEPGEAGEAAEPDAAPDGEQPAEA